MAKIREACSKVSSQLHNHKFNPTSRGTNNHWYHVLRPIIIKLAHDHAWDRTSFEDLCQEGCIGLLEALRSYDDTRSSLPTYVYSKVKGRMSNWCRKEKHALTLSSPYSGNKYVSLSEPVLVNNGRDTGTFRYEHIVQATGREICPEDYLSQLDVKKLVIKGLSVLTEKQKKALYHLIWDDYSPSEVADEMGVSRPRVTAIIKSALSNARTCLQCAARVN